MSWHARELCCVLIVTLMMTSSVFCLAILSKGNLIQSGRLVIGSSGSTEETKMHVEHLGDMTGYQSDQPAMMGSRLAMLRLRRLSPSVQCDNDSMSLHVKGRQVPNFLVETSEKGPVSLSQMPSSCGYSVRRARRDLSLSANYDCCAVQQQGNTYILPLSFSGVALKVVCPMAPPRTMVFCSSSDMVANLPTSLEVLRLKLNGVWQPLSQVTTCGFAWESVGDGLTLTAPYSSPCWHFEGAERRLSVQYAGVELTLSCPAVATSLYGLPGEQTDAPMATIAPDRDSPAYQWAPGLYYPYFMPWYPPVIHATIAPTTTTTVAPASADDNLGAPWLPGLQYPHFRPWHFQNPVIPSAPAGVDQQVLPLFPGWHFHYRRPGVPAFAPTTPATTVAPSNFDQPYVYPWLPEVKNPYSPVAFHDNSGPNNGVTQQIPWLNAFSKNQHFQRPGFPVVKPFGYASHLAQLFPIQVKADARK